MKATDFLQNTFEAIQDSMDFNGYAHFNYKAYKKKDNTPCFIPENGDSMQDVESWQSMFKEVLETVKTKEFLMAVCEHYEDDIALTLVDNLKESNIDYNTIYLDVTESTPEQFAESFMDNYFLGGDEVWCSISTKLQDYMM